MLPVECPRCKNSWNYKGKRLMTNCPNCAYTIRLNKLVENNDSIHPKLEEKKPELVEEKNLIAKWKIKALRDNA